MLNPTGGPMVVLVAAIYAWMGGAVKLGLVNIHCLGDWATISPQSTNQLGSKQKMNGHIHKYYPMSQQRLLLSRLRLFSFFYFFSYLRKWRFIIELQNKLIIVKLVHYYFISWNISSVILDGPCALLPTLKPIIWLLEPAHQNGVQPTI